MPKAPRGKRVGGPLDDVVSRSSGKAPNGQAQPYFDKSRGVWVAPWRKPDGKVGRPTGRTRALAVASRDRHMAKTDDDARSRHSTRGSRRIRRLPKWQRGGCSTLPAIGCVRRRLPRTRSRCGWSGLELGEIPARQLRPEQVAAFISDLIDRGSPSRARNVRTLLVQIMDQAVGLGLAADNVARRVRTPRVPQVRRRTITPAETQQLLAECDGRFAAAVALCYVQGWRISEVLGLAWQDIDLDSRTVRLRRGSTYTDGIGMVLGPTKTQRTAGLQSLSPTVIGLLSTRRQIQDDDRVKIGGDWPATDYDGERLDLVFTTAAGTPMLRQHVDRAIRAAAAGRASTRPGSVPTPGAARS